MIRNDGLGGNGECSPMKQSNRARDESMYPIHYCYGKIFKQQPALRPELVRPSVMGAKFGVMSTWLMAEVVKKLLKDGHRP